LTALQQVDGGKTAMGDREGSEATAEHWTRKKLSAKARKAIGEAQKKRWAELKKKQGKA